LGEHRELGRELLIFALRFWRDARFSARLTDPRQRNAAPTVSALQARTYAEAKASPTEVSSILEQRIRGVQEESGLAETGRVLSVGYVFQHERVLATDNNKHHMDPAARMLMPGRVLVG
jgi:hypothetical protein